MNIEIDKSEVWMINPDGTKTRLISLGMPTIKSETIVTKKLGIKDVKLINDKVVIVYFTDGTKSKAVCAEGDTFSLEAGIGICIAKRMMSSDEQIGTSRYNNAIKQALKVMKRNQQIEESDKRIREEIKKSEEKARLKRQKRAEKRRQRRIEEQAQAIILAKKMKLESDN